MNNNFDLKPTLIVHKIAHRQCVVTRAVSCLGIVIGIGCWVWFVNGIL